MGFYSVEVGVALALLVLVVFVVLVQNLAQALMTRLRERIRLVGILRESRFQPYLVPPEPL